MPFAAKQLLSARERLGVAGRVSRGVEDDILSVEVDVPGFGGLYADSSGNLHGYVTNLDRAPAARRALENFMSTKLGGLTRSDGTARDVLIEKGDYSFSELVAWEEILSKSLSRAQHVVFLDADEKLNRVRVGIDDKASTQELMHTAELVGIPTQALTFDEYAGTFETQANYPDHYRPLTPGFQIQTRYGGSNYTCTAGFIVVRDGVRYMLTAAHCMNDYNGALGAPVYQREWSLTDFLVGVEAVNPAFSTSCVALATYCRGSDAALVALSDTVSARTDTVSQSTTVGGWNGPGSFTMGTLYQVVQGWTSPVVGWTVDKTGRTTGTTQGQIVSTCLNNLVVSLPGSFGTENIPCTIEAQYYDDAGDSGAAVYASVPPWLAQFKSAVGIHYAGYTPTAWELLRGTKPRAFISSWNGIVADLGTLTF